MLRRVSAWRAAQGTRFGQRARTLRPERPVHLDAASCAGQRFVMTTGARDAVFPRSLLFGRLDHSGRPRGRERAGLGVFAAHALHPAWTHLFTATTMRRDMGMTYWLQMSEAT